MDAIIGKYRLHVENAHVILTHEAGICFDLNEYEIAGLQHFLSTHLHEQEHKQAQDSDTITTLPPKDAWL